MTCLTPDLNNTTSDTGRISNIHASLADFGTVALVLFSESSHVSNFPRSHDEAHGFFLVVADTL